MSFLAISESVPVIMLKILMILAVHHLRLSGRGFLGGSSCLHDAGGASA